MTTQIEIVMLMSRHARELEAGAGICRHLRGVGHGTGAQFGTSGEVPQWHTAEPADYAAAVPERQGLPCGWLALGGEDHDTARTYPGARSARLPLSPRTGDQAPQWRPGRQSTRESQVGHPRGEQSRQVGTRATARTAASWPQLFTVWGRLRGHRAWNETVPEVSQSASATAQDRRRLPERTPIRCQQEKRRALLHALPCRSNGCGTRSARAAG